MSSILEALKKLDNVSSSREQSSPLADLKFPSSQIKREIWPLTKKQILYAGIAVAILCMMVLGWFLWQKPEESISQPVQPAATVPSVDLESTTATAQPKKSAVQPSGPPAPQPTTPSKRSLKKATFSKNYAVATPPPNQALSSAKAGTPNLPAVPLLEDQNIKMQAISWAVQPENRIAVINAKIVREGDSIGGYRITEIREDGVIVRKGGQAHKLEIRLK